MPTQSKTTQTESKGSTLYIIVDHICDVETVAVVQDGYSNHVCMITIDPPEAIYEHPKTGISVYYDYGIIRYPGRTLTEAIDAIKADEARWIKIANHKRLKIEIAKRQKEITILTQKLHTVKNDLNINR